MRSGKVIDQRDQFQQHAQIEVAHGDVTIIGNRRCAPIGPFARNAEAAALCMTQKQCVGAGDTPRLQYGKALASEGMKRMTDLSPTQMLAEHLCSSR